MLTTLNTNTTHKIKNIKKKLTKNYIKNITQKF